MCGLRIMYETHRCIMAARERVKDCKYMTAFFIGLVIWGVSVVYILVDG
jgi:hypothetical protein